MENSRKLAGLLVLGAIWNIGQAGAQSRSADGELVAAASRAEPPRVIVSGDRFEQPSAAISPAGVEVISGEAIRRTGATSVYDALRALGAVHTRSSQVGTPDDSVDLRGFGITGDQNTLVLVDGVRVSENELQPARLASIPLSGIERIEISRGSGAVLHGSGATGGVIHVITRGADAGERAIRAGALVDSYRTLDRRLDGRIAGERLDVLGGAYVAADFAANRLSTGNYRRHNDAAQENFTGRVRLVGRDGEIGLRVATERTHSQLPGPLNEAQYAADPRATTRPLDWSDTDANRYVLYGNARVGAFDLAAEVYHRDKVDRSLFAGASPFSFPTFTRSGSAVTGASPRLKWQADLLGARNQLVLGYDHSRWSYRSQSATGFHEGILAAAGLNSDASGTQTNRAFYVRNETRAGGWTLSAGARRERVRQTIVDPVNIPTGARPFERDLHAEEIALAWAFHAGWNGWLRAGNSYRIGNIDETQARFQAFPTPLGFLEPQTSRDLGAGVAFSSQGLDASVSTFSHRLINEIMFAVEPGVNSANVNLPPTRREGVELRVAWRPMPGLDISASATQTSARFMSGSFGGLGLAGKQVPLVPRTRASLSAGWRVTAQDYLFAVWQRVGGQVMDNDQANNFARRIPAYDLVDVRYTRRLGGFELSAGINNLLDRNYYAYAIRSAFTPGVYNVYPERRRALFLGATVRF